MYENKKTDKQARCRCESDYNVKKTRGIKKETDRDTHVKGPIAELL